MNIVELNLAQCCPFWPGILPKIWGVYILLILERNIFHFICQYFKYKSNISKTVLLHYAYFNYKANVDISEKKNNIGISV